MMAQAAPVLLNFSLLGYVMGAVAGLLFFRRERLANLFAFGGASVAGLSGTIGSILLLLDGATLPHPSVLPRLIPYVDFTIRAQPLGLFFVLIVSLLALALSMYSLGYACGFYGRKNVGVL